MKMQVLKTMEDKDTVVSAFFGLIGGMYFFLHHFLDTMYFESLFKAALTATVCGFMGVFGKYVFSFVKRPVLNWFRTKFKIKRK